ncbi:PREDICTED: ribonuclease [Prunus dulcis]|uniref:PREDICTED: ribonuclease n=1 Tax=Prunus dulcis TaxID=3755 RepID=A0A5E4F4Y6_PRUDU|nr:PREDICTED: ribonuclease [Prunus dulcis]
MQATHTIPKGLSIPVELAWVHPGIGAFKLNVDGTCKPWSRAIGAGGVICDSVGDWVGGFSVNLGIGQILEVELWGLFFGLQLAVDRGISNLVIDMDSALVVHLMKSPDTFGGHPLAGLLASCWDFIKLLRDCDLQHVYREQNCLADCVANGLGSLDPVVPVV